MRASLKNKRIGETRMQNCGSEAKIVGYRNTLDINVQFSDGKIVEHRGYKEFIKGHIKHPDIDRLKERANKRIGEVRMQNCGLEAKIVDYRNNMDIDVQFSDGRIVEHRSYTNFKRGGIKHPDIFTNKTLGKKQIQNCGLEAEIVGCRSRLDIDVQFPDGETVEHRSYDSFKHREIAHPTLFKHFSARVKKIHPSSRTKLYHTQIHGIACVTNDIYYYYCHCPICLAHEIWTFDEIKDHKCNHALVQERDELIKARSRVPAA